MVHGFAGCVRQELRSSCEHWSCGSPR